MIANRDGLKGLINREDVLQELDCQAVGHQGGPLGFQIEQVRGGAFWQQGGQGTKAHGGVRLTWTMVEARTLDRECPEDGAKHRVMDALAAARFPTMWTGAVLLEIRVHLPLDDYFLQGLEHRFAFRQRETECLRRQLLPFDSDNLPDGFLSIVGDGHHLDLDLHGLSSADHTKAWSCV